MKYILMVLLTTVASSNALACMGLFAETRTFFKKLPTELEKEEIIAKVQIISTKVESRRRITKTAVVLAIKGIEKLDKLTVVSDGLHSCNRDDWIKQGDVVFIAGKVNKKGIFKGTWKGVLNQ